MKIILIVLLFLINALTFNLSAQEKSFSNYEIGFYAGVNFESGDNIGADYLLELKTNLNENFKLKLSAGFSQLYIKESYVVKSSSSKPIEIDGIVFYSASEFEVKRRDFDLFAFSAGIQYGIIKSHVFEPYVSVDAFYNDFTNIMALKKWGGTWSYNTYEEIPDEFKHEKTVKYPDHSFGGAIGLGSSIAISKSIKLDLRYIYKIDNEIANTHHVLFGIYF